MCGSEIEIVEGLPSGKRRTPIYIGTAAQKVFGPVGKTKAGLYAFRVVANNKGVGLYGESETGTSYAIYELLHRLGCRWYMPTELGEVVPSKPNLAVPAMDEALAPATESRGIWQGGKDYLRRNRMDREYPGAAQGALERWITKEQLDAHPEWRMVSGGKPIGMFRFSHPEVARTIADNIITSLDKDYRPYLSLCPGDYVMAVDDPEDMKADPKPRIWGDAAGRWSITDRMILLVNRVAERVGKKYPKVKFGILAYVNYSMPPARYPVHPNVVVTIAPIDFNRHHPMTWPDHPNKFWLRDMVEGWGKKASHLAAYWYGMNLAELSAPNPFITKWGTDIPILLKNHLAHWQPETMAGWDSMLPGYVLGARLTFHADEKPEAILQDLWTRFYGPAAAPMGRYWNRIDRAWIDAREYSGAHWGYLRIFTPEVMQGARADINEALKLAGKPNSLEYRRVKLIDESFGLFQQYMKMREDWAAGKVAKLAADYDTWRTGVSDQVERYKDPADSTYVQGRYGTLRYPDIFIAVAYKDASRMEKTYAHHGAPLLEWKWKYNPGAEADALPWTAPAFDDKDWPKTHVVRETWSTIGHHNTMSDKESGRSGRMAYRNSLALPALPKGKKAFLWIGSTDGKAKLYVNGKHVKYVVPKKTRTHKEGDEIDAFNGFCQPALFDVTKVLRTGDNQITILAERHFLNELGTGGLMGPVMIYREK
ncbi:MAG: DUF4838 domain-containing protein [Planctomycetota bacterium]|jgi:hypothetical protein